MKPFQLVFIMVYLPTLFLYLFNETSGNFKKRAINKIALASLFFICSLYSFFTRDKKDYLHTLLMIAITFSWIGDILLLWGFMKGGIPFFIGNLIYSVFAILYFRSLNIQFLSLYFVLLCFFVSIFLFMCFTKYIDLSKMKPFFIYMLSIISHGCLGVIMMIKNVEILKILGLGLFLFMISDYFLAIHQFRDKNNKLVLRMNSLSYFSGMMLVALTMGM